MYEKTLKSTEKMTNGNDVTHNTKHTILFNKTKFTPYSVPHAPASVRPEKTMNTNNDDGDWLMSLRWQRRPHCTGIFIVAAQASSILLPRHLHRCCPGVVAVVAMEY